MTAFDLCPNINSHLCIHTYKEGRAKAVSFRDVSSLILNATIITKKVFLLSFNFYSLALDHKVTNTILEENNYFTLFELKKS